MKLRRILAFICVGVTLMIALSISAIADNATENGTTVRKEVVFLADTSFSPEEQEIIRAHFMKPDDEVQQYGLKCSIFGHDYKTEIVSVVTHKVRDNHPRCLKETFETKICTVCSDTVSKQINREFIHCCD